MSKANNIASLPVSNSNIDITGYAKVSLVELANSNAVTYDLSQGNIARWNRETSPVDATNTLTFTGTAGGTLDGMGFSIMAFNGDDDSDRTITFAGDTGITVFYGDSSTVTWAGPNQHTIISGLVFDSATVMVNQIAMVGSV
jgi:hypothetical protein